MEKPIAKIIVVLMYVSLFVFIGLYAHDSTMNNTVDAHEVTVAERDRSIGNLQATNANLVQMLNVFTGGKRVLVTAYNALPNQTDDTPTITASNETVQVGGLALSRDFLKVFDRKNSVAYGDTVLLITPMRTNDTMNERYAGRADVFMWDYSDAVAFGVKEGLVYYD